MKHRDYKKFAKGSIYHLYNRGNNKDRVFFDEQDYRSFLFRIGIVLGIDKKILNQEDLLGMPKSRVQIVSLPPTLFKIHSFCLMPNHFHILIEQCGDIPVSKLMLKVSTSFAMYINKKYKRVGNIFQDCFKSVSIDNNTQLMWVISYIHMNPVKDGIVANPYDYKWSSYNDFTGEKNLPIVSQDLVPELFGSKENFIRQNFTLSKKDLLRATLSSF
ncbi:MAG: transposase [Patescibacteria group bacterium]